MTHSVTTKQPVESVPTDQSALEQLVTTAAAIEAEWAAGARQVEELERQAERIRDEARQRTAALEEQQADAIVVLYRTRSIEELAQVLGVPLDDALRVVREAEERVALRLPLQRSE